MDPNDAFLTFMTGGTVAVALGIALWIGSILFSIWVTYTVIWLAVRRGLKEYFDSKPKQSMPIR